MVYFISAVGENYEYGKDGSLPWDTSSPGAKTDMLAFKFYTHGKTIIMGWNTWESIDYKPLPGRTNVVISRKKQESQHGEVYVKSLEEAITAYPNGIVIGGAATLTELCKKYPDKIHGGVVNVFKYGFPQCDTFFNLDMIPLLYKKYDFDYYVRREYFSL